MFHDTVCVCLVYTTESEGRHRESTLLGKLFDIRMEDVINRKQDPPQCPAATRQGHSKHPQHKHVRYVDIYSYQACQNIKGKAWKLSP